MPESGTGERITPVLDYPSRDGVHRHPAGAYVDMIDGSVMCGIEDRAPESPTVADA
jgi:hypothetical protein